jgi:hypothetical protein
LKGKIMKTLAMCTMMLMIFSAAPVFAGSCGGGCDKDKDDQAYSFDYQLLCGGNKGDKPAPQPEMMCDTCGCKKDKGCDKPKPAPKPESELYCGGGSYDQSTLAPELFGGGCGRDKEETKV